MISRLILLVVIFLSVYAHSNSPCDEFGGMGEAPVKKRTLWSSIFGDPPPIQGVDCEREKDRLKLENKLEEYKDRAAEKLISLEKNIGALKAQSSRLAKSIEESEANNANNIGELQLNQSSNQEAIEALRSDLLVSIDALDSRLDTLSAGIEKAKKEMDSKVEISRGEARKTAVELSQLLKKNLIYVAMSIILVLLVLSVVFFLLRKKISDQRVDLTGGLIETRKSLEEEFVKIDSKLVDIFESQIRLADSNQASSNADVDHSLVTKVADEIVRIRKNICRMDEKTKGLKQLSASVARIQDNVASNGYEIVEMLGAPYREGMKAVVDFVVDESLSEGEQIITRIIKPQINYKGVMIQSAHIEVSQGE